MVGTTGRTAALVLLACSGIGDAESLAELTYRLMDAYGPEYIRPSLAAASASGMCTESVPPEQVTVQVYIDQLLPFDMLRQTYAFDGYLRVWWQDDRLRYNGTANGGCTDELSLKWKERPRIWKPEFYWEGAKTITMPVENAGTGELLKVYPDGSVWWSRQTSFVLSCPVDADALPFDTQKCVFLMGMYAETAAEVVLRWKPDATALSNWNRACLAEWYPTSSTQEDIFQTYASGSYTYARAELDFSRTPQRYMLSYFLPSVIMVAVSYLGFYIDPHSTPARATLGMLCLLVVMTNFVSLNESLPPTPSLPWLTRFALGSFVFNAIAMIEQVLVSFGLNARAWLEEQRGRLGQSLPWMKALVQNRAKVVALFELFDENCDGVLTKREFRRGVLRLGINAKDTELNALFERFDIDGDGRLVVSELDTLLEALEEEIEAAEASTKIIKTPVKDPPLRFAPNDTAAASASEEEADGPSGSGAAASLAKAYAVQAPQEVLVTVEGGPAEAPAAKDEPSGVCEPVKGATEGDSAGEKAARARFSTSGSVGQLVRSVTTTVARGSSVDSSKAEMKMRYRSKVKEDLDRGKVWECKVFCLFPILENLQHLDHLSRLLFPLAYITFVLLSLSEVSFGAPHQALLASSACAASA